MCVIVFMLMVGLAVINIVFVVFILVTNRVAQTVIDMVVIQKNR
jgi:hypothetical protein